MQSPKFNAIFSCLVFWILFLGGLLVTGKFLSPMLPPAWERFIYGTGGTLTALLLTWIFLRFDNRRFRDYALNWEMGTLPRFFKGLLTGALLFLLILLALLYLGDMQISRNQTELDPVTFFWLLPILPLAWMEELAFRSYPLLKLKKAFGFRTTQFIVAIAFALYHLVTGWNPLISFLGPGIWALVFGLAAIWSKGIAFPTGIHVALNTAQQLVGMKGNSVTSFWTVTHKSAVNAETFTAADKVGLASQLFILIGAIVLTEIYIRRKRNGGY